jgi:hypothetical protein
VRFSNNRDEKQIDDRGGFVSVDLRVRRENSDLPSPRRHEAGAYH